MSNTFGRLGGFFNKFKTVLSIFCIFGITTKVGAQGNLLNDSGFESPVLPGSISSQVFVSGDHIGLWTVGLGSDRLQRNSNWAFSEGQQALELLGTINYSGVMPSDGVAYQLTFDMTSNPLTFQGAQDTVSLTIRAQNGFYQDLNLGSFSAPFVAQGGALNWVTYTVDFTTISPSSTLSLIGLSQNGYGPIIDNVQLEIAPTPEPSSIALFVFGAASLFAIRRRITS